MKIFAIGDLHLSLSKEKPMDVFGVHWEGHWERICAAWEASVEQQDIVLIPGDISWAMTLTEADPDLRAIAALPGTKVILRGNHDYWWASLSKLLPYEKLGIYTLQNNAYRFGSAVLCGTRGWLCPGSNQYSKGTDEKIYQREAIRLKLSLDAGQRLRQPGDRLITMFHYPPLCDAKSDTVFLQQIREYGVDTVVYGHLHGPSFPWVYEGMQGDTAYHLVSCDYLNFAPKLIAEL
ncbi:MAG: metallophosphoesterase [Eubacteriales bacterium]|nr:metallophosphoesterase [Eubacteriales bacterium]